MQLCYKHDSSGWFMCLVQSPEDEVAAEKERNRYTYEKPCES